MCNNKKCTRTGSLKCVVFTTCEEECEACKYFLCPACRREFLKKREPKSHSVALRTKAYYTQKPSGKT